MAFHHPGPGSASGSASSSSSGFHFPNSLFGDTTYTKVFVGGLAWETKSETLRRHFEQFGETLEAVVITDKNTGRSKGYGFVTFRDPESARRACADPSPVIDGRRANCNLASLGRSRPFLPFGGTPLESLLLAPEVRPLPWRYVSSARAICWKPAHQQSVPFSYQEGLPYAAYSYNLYGPEYVYPQNAYNPYTGQPYVQVYGFPGAINTAIYPFDQFGQPIPPGYTALHGYTLPTQPIMQLSGPNVNGMASAPRPVIQAPYPAGNAISMSWIGFSHVVWDIAKLAQIVISSPNSSTTTCHSSCSVTTVYAGQQFRSNDSLNVHHDIILRYITNTLRLQQDQEQQYCHVNGLHSCLAIYHLCILEVVLVMISCKKPLSCSDGGS
ncbi:hypothetical protein MUK42_15917 [Musa troglodytarum]|uniref:RRM domain-containing protein n=1 Tax=Musa troglodytarum TaxID=320322 RepID=A0A9E7HUU2_9LILI|nr:hypothetical protein MUK42_15917 [Musa troglodytarum]